MIITKEINKAMLVASRYANLAQAAENASTAIRAVLTTSIADALNDEERKQLRDAERLLDNVALNHSQYSAQSYIMSLD